MNRTSTRSASHGSTPVPLLGAHTSIAGGTPRALERAKSVRANVMQIFVKNNIRWQGKTLSDEEVAEFHRIRQKSRLLTVVGHDSYLINLASPDRDLWAKSIRATIEELARCQRLGLSHLVCHPGAHVGSGESRGIRRVAAALDRILETLPESAVRIALETTAGQGTSLSYTFAQLRDILGDCRFQDRVDICLDTCHVFAAGYDFRTRTGYHEMMTELDSCVGLDRLQVVHCNDSKRELGSRVDRHEHIGQGQIGCNGFAWILRDRRLAAVPKILETPKGKDLKEDRRNLRVLRKLSRNGETRD